MKTYIDFESWKKCGLDREYNKRNPSTFYNSEQKEERSWYNHGQRNKWLADFEFTRLKNDKLSEIKEKTGIDLVQYLKKEHYRKTPAKIARRFGVSSEYIKSLLKRNNIGQREFRRRKKPNGFYRNMGDEDLIKFISKNYSTRGISQFAKEDCAAYEEARKRKLIEGLVKENILFRKMSRWPMSNSQFQDFLKNNQPALNLAGATVILNGQGSDAERIILELYQGKFKDLQQLHSLINKNKEDIYKIIGEGLTNLGTYLGDFSLEDRAIIPVLIGQAVSGFRNEEITHSIEDKIICILRSQYSPRFNENQSETIKTIKENADRNLGIGKEIYHKLLEHYQEVMKLQEELA